MKKYNFLLCFILITIIYFDLYSQNYDFIVRADGSYYLPVSSLTQRFKYGYGGNLAFGFKNSENWEWLGKIEYIDFKENRDKFNFTKKMIINGIEKSFTVPLPLLTTNLKIYGLSANANYKPFENNFLKANLTFGFGIYYWTSERSAYFDTLRADTGGGKIDLQIIKVPHLRQEDWSGGFNFGAEVNVKIINPVWIRFGANYKVIVGELWPSLELNLENIAAFQMLELSAGLRVEL